MAAQIDTVFGRIADAAEDAEQARWQRRIERVIASYAQPFDASGNESGDPLDFTADQVEHALSLLEEQRDEARARIATLEAALGESETTARELRLILIGVASTLSRAEAMGVPGVSGILELVRAAAVARSKP